MSENLVYIAKIIYYFMFVFATYLLIVKRKNKADETVENGKKYIIKKRISIITIIVLCLIFGYYGVICGPNPPKLDRLNYAFKFENESQIKYVKEGSLGLYYIELFLHLFTYNSDILFFTIAFIYYFLTFKAYNCYDKIEPLAILLLLFSSYGLFGFYMLKQSMAIALIAISFAYFFKNKIIHTIIYVTLAILFHESAWIVIPLYIALLGSKAKWHRILLYLVLFTCLIFFNKINALIIKTFSFLPGISNQVSEYLNETGEIISQKNYLTVFKGLPYYIITIIGFIKRKALINKINHYDKYLMLSTFCSIATLLSSYMYWMWRFAAYCYFPVFVFTSLIATQMSNKKEKSCFVFLVGGILFLLTLKLLIQYYYKYGGIV